MDSSYPKNNCLLNKKTGKKGQNCDDLAFLHFELRYSLYRVFLLYFKKGSLKIEVLINRAKKKKFIFRSFGRSSRISLCYRNRLITFL